jgi:hypothetical protein
MPSHDDVAPDRPTALQQGSRFYRGLPCSAGHDDIRYASSGNCRACQVTKGNAYRTSRRDAEAARKRDWRRRKLGSAPAPHETPATPAAPAPDDVDELLRTGLLG